MASKYDKTVALRRATDESTMRDDFAKAALTGLLASSNHTAVENATTAYNQAEAMLAEREARAVADAEADELAAKVADPAKGKHPA